MENASKALLIAGGILIAIITLSLFMIMINQVSEYQASSSNRAQETKIADFNKQFAQLAQSGVKGMDVISAINMVIDFNQKNDGAIEIDYSQNIRVNVNMGNFNTTVGELLFGGDTSFRNIEDEGSEFYEIINKQREAEVEYGGTNVLSALSSNEQSIKNNYDPEGEGDPNGDKITIAEALGRRNLSSELQNLENLFRAGNFTILEAHTEYSRFKTSTFDGEVTGYHDDTGQISELTFTYVE